jgi:hypothetical protein
MIGSLKAVVWVCRAVQGMGFVGGWRLLFALLLLISGCDASNHWLYEVAEYQDCLEDPSECKRLYVISKSREHLPKTQYDGSTGPSTGPPPSSPKTAIHLHLHLR